MPDAGAYLTLKLAQELFHKTPDTLDDTERKRVGSVAARQQLIEQRILATEEAARVVLPEESLEQNFLQIRNRYASDEEFRADLARSGLAAASLRAALRRDMTVEAVLERVASRSAKVSDTDIEIFYLMHKERFRRQETRTLRQILVTINEALPGNERAAAQEKIAAIRARLRKSPERFAEQALKHSECPSAMNGGLLGDMPRGKLFAELETVAFQLAAGGLSAPVESPIGFHLLRCDAIQAERTLPVAEVRDTIRQHLNESRRQICQKAWIGQLFRQTA